MEKNKKFPCLQFHTRFMEIMRAWPVTEDKPRRFPLQPFAVFNSLLYLVFFICIANQTRLAPTDLPVLTESWEVFVTLAAAGHKLMSMSAWQQRRWRALVRMVEPSGSLGRRVAAQKHAWTSAEWLSGARDRLRKCDALSRLLALALVCTASGCVGLLNLKFPLEAALRRAGVLPPLENNHEDWQFPIRMVVPGIGVPRDGVRYAAVYAFHTLMGGLHVFYIPACDGLLAGLMLHACAHLILLRLRFEELGKHLDKEKASSYEYDNLLKSQMADCVQYHQDILTFVAELEALTSPLMLSQLFNSALSLCTTAFHVLQSGSDVMKILSQLCFFGGNFVELGAFCFFADRIKEESEAVAHSAYAGDWVGAGTAHASSLRMVVARTHRPAKLTVGGFAELSLETYGDVLKGSFTYFTLLREITE